MKQIATKRHSLGTYSAACLARFRYLATDDTGLISTVPRPQHQNMQAILQEIAVYLGFF